MPFIIADCTSLAVQAAPPAQHSLHVVLCKALERIFLVFSLYYLEPCWWYLLQAWVTQPVVPGMIINPRQTTFLAEKPNWPAGLVSLAFHVTATPHSTDITHRKVILPISFCFAFSSSPNIKTAPTNNNQQTLLNPFPGYANSLLSKYVNGRKFEISNGILFELKYFGKILTVKLLLHDECGGHSRCAGTTLGEQYWV